MKHTEVNLVIHIRHRGESFITPERLQLLKMVKATGSLNAAAKQLSMSYQSAWSIMDSMNKIAPAPLVVKQRGGSGGGGATLSDYGMLILKEYAFIEEQVNKFTYMLNNEINL